MAKSGTWIDENFPPVIISINNLEILPPGKKEIEKMTIELPDGTSCDVDEKSSNGMIIYSSNANEE